MHIESDLRKIDHSHVWILYIIRTHASLMRHATTTWQISLTRTSAIGVDLTCLKRKINELNMRTRMHNEFDCKVSRTFEAEIREVTLYVPEVY